MQVIFVGHLRKFWSFAGNTFYYYHNSVISRSITFFRSQNCNIADMNFIPLKRHLVANSDLKKCKNSNQDVMIFTGEDLVAASLTGRICSCTHGGLCACACGTDNSVSQNHGLSRILKELTIQISRWCWSVTCYLFVLKI